MAEGMFSVFPDGQLTSGHGLKGNVPRPKKKALCDVKNTLQSKRTGLNEPLRKLNLEQVDSVSKQTIKETPSKVIMKQEGTFAIARDQENEVFWNKCSDCHPHNDELFNMRPESSRLQKVDIDYLATGLFSQQPRVNLLEDDMGSFNGLRNDSWFDLEVRIPPFSPADIEEPILLLSDDE